jgi:pyruvate/2-oxoglutarate dehydrogenase complex dihydrolipoamide acyltransferase (E2) component
MQNYRRVLRQAQHKYFDRLSTSTSPLRQKLRAGKLSTSTSTGSAQVLRQAQHKYFAPSTKTQGRQAQHRLSDRLFYNVFYSL